MSEKDPYTAGTAAQPVGFTAEVKFTRAQQDTIVVDSVLGVTVMTSNPKKGWSAPWRGVMRAVLHLIEISPNARAELRDALAKWGDA